MKPLLLMTGAITFLLALLYVGAAAYISSPHARNTATDLLTRQLHTRVSIGQLSLAGSRLRARGVGVWNPGGYPAMEMLAIDEVEIQPSLSIFRGKFSFRTIRMTRPRLDLQRNQAKEWNLSHLNPPQRKKKAGEAFIGSLVITDGVIRVEGHELTDVTLKLSDFSSKGNVDTGLAINGMDQGRNRFNITAKGRSSSAFTVNLTAPAVDLKSYSRYFRRFGFLDPGRTKVGVQATAAMTGGNVSVNGTMAGEDLGILVGGSRIPVNFTLALSGYYSRETGESRVNLDRLVLNEVVKMKGDVAFSRSNGAENGFKGSLTMLPFDIEEALAQLPPKARDRLKGTSGRIEPVVINFKGNGSQGLTLADGHAGITDGRFVRDGRDVADNVTADMTLHGGKANVFRVDGIVRSGGSERSIIGDIRLPFTLDLNRRLRITRAHTPRFSARTRGIALSGNAEFSPRNHPAYRFSISVPPTPAKVLAELLPGVSHPLITEGSGTLSFSASGDTIAAIHAVGTATLANVAGKIGTRPFSIERAAVSGDITGIGPGMTAAGEVSVTGGRMAGKRFSARVPFSRRDNTWTLAEGMFNVDGTSIRFASVSTPAPTSPPFIVALKDVSIRHGEAGLAYIGGTLKVGRKSGGYSLPESEGELDLPEIWFRGHKAGSLQLHLVSGRVNRVEAKGTALGGTLAASLNLDPYAPGKYQSFKVLAADMHGPTLDSVLKGSSGARLAAGNIGATVHGKSAGGAINAQVEIVGTELGLNSRTGRSILTGAHLAAKAQVAGNDLLVHSAEVVTGKGTRLSAAGKVTNVMSGKRRGSFSITVPPAPITAWLDETVEILPPLLQEATASGTVRGDGTLEVTGTTYAANGVVSIQDGGFSNEAQKLHIKGIAGSVPLSFTPVASEMAEEEPGQFFSRENYPEWHRRLLGKKDARYTLNLERVQFGTLEISSSLIGFDIVGGGTSVSYVRGTLYTGTLLGSGLFRLGAGASYRLNLMVADASLKKVCDAVPAIRGYMSGKVDGILSLRGGSEGIKGLKGFTDLWAKAAKDEKMLVSKEFLQKLAGKKFKGIFFRNDRPYDNAEVSAYLEEGYLTFTRLDISHTNIFGIRDLSVAVAPVSNRISLDHLLQTIREAATRGKASPDEREESPPPIQPEFKWEE